MLNISSIGLIMIAVFLGAIFGTAGMRRYAIARQVVDVPNARSSHAVTTPRGGGLAFVLCSIAGLIAVSLISGRPQAPLLALGIGGFIVAGIGFLDDHGHVPAQLRLIVQSLASLVVILLLMPWFPGGVWYLKILLLLVSMVWVINVFNFMDGVDAMASAEALFILIGGALFYRLAGDVTVAIQLMVCAAAVLGFLLWNLPPARIFMGDVGSGYLGLLAGGAAVYGIVHHSVSIWIWVILMGIFLVDATVTISRRILRGSRWFEAHRCHAYQHATRRWTSHAKVTGAVTLINVTWLFPWSLAAWYWPRFGLVFAAVSLAPLVYLALRLDAGIEERP